MVSAFDPPNPFPRGDIHHDAWARQPPQTVDIDRFGDGSPVPDAAPGEQRLDTAAVVERETQRILARHEAEANVRAMSRPPIPTSYMLGDLLAMPLPEVRYRISELWPVGGRIILSAQAKTGKSTMRDNLARSLIDGARFLDRFDVTPAQSIAMIDVELALPTLQLWLRDQGIRNGGLRVWPLRGAVAAFDILDERCRAEWAKLLRGHDILIVDCLGPILATFGLDESKNPDVGRWLAAFDELLDAAGTSEALIVHHMGHGAERSRGASRLQDWPDAIWKVVREEPAAGKVPDPTRYFSAEGRDVSVREGALSFDAIDRHLSLSGGSRAAAKVERDKWVVVEYVRQHPEQCRAEIESGLGEELSHARTRAAVSKAIDGGLLAEVSAGRNRRNIVLASQLANSPESAETPDVLL